MKVGMRVQSTNAVQMWYDKCYHQRILAKAARFSYTCSTWRHLACALCCSLRCLAALA